MNRFLLPLLAALALPTAVNAGVDPAVHNLCKDVSDYMGCVKANSKKEGWNFFKKDNNKILKLTKEQKIKWCDYGDYNDEYMKLVNNCIANLESLGPKAINNLSIEIHERCSSPDNFDIYLECLSKLGQDISKFNKVESALIKKEREEVRANNLREAGAPSLEEEIRANNLEVFNHKGETYTASRTCSEGKRFYWNIEKGFLKKEKVVEIGCLSDYELQSLKNQSRSGGGSGSGAAARMDMETKMRWNNINQNYRNDFKNWQMKEFGY